MIVRPRESTLPASLLAGVLASPAIKRRLEGQAQGATMLNLNQRIVGELKVPVPDREDVKAYEARLVELRRLEYALTERLRVQEDLLRALQARAFRGEL